MSDSDTSPIAVLLQKATSKQQEAEKELGRLHDLKRENDRKIEEQVARINHFRGAVSALEGALKATQTD